MTAGLAIGSGWSRSHAERTVARAADKEMTNEKDAVEREETDETPGSDEEIMERIYGEKLYQDVVADEEIVKKVCEKYGLDSDTVYAKDLTREMRNYEEALWIVKEMGNLPLLAQHAENEEGGGINSLEIYICEIYAFGEGKAVIEGKCREFGVNPHETTVSELTIEQLIEIGEEAYEVSDHPKG